MIPTDGLWTSSSVASAKAQTGYHSHVHEVFVFLYLGMTPIPQSERTGRSTSPQLLTDDPPPPTPTSTPMQTNSWISVISRGGVIQPQLTDYPASPTSAKLETKLTVRFVKPIAGFVSRGGGGGSGLSNCQCVDQEHNLTTPPPLWKQNQCTQNTKMTALAMAACLP